MREKIFELFDAGYTLDGVIREYWDYPANVISELWVEWYENRKHKPA